MFILYILYKHLTISVITTKYDNILYVRFQLFFTKTILRNTEDFNGDVFLLLYNASCHRRSLVFHQFHLQ